MPTVAGFWGREQELAWLQSLWTQATQRDDAGRFVGGPRMAVVVAETGIGKSRLVQAFYQQLTADPDWDPPDSAYWPDSFQHVENQLRVKPEFGAHVPNGPPKFLWLGARWYPPDDRNVDDRRCVLPDLRTVLRMHADIARSHTALWRRLRVAGAHAIKHEGVEGAIELGADLAEVIPLGGLVVKAVRTAARAFQRATTVSHEMDERSEEEANELLAELGEVFGGWSGTGIVLPTVLWLDDAQWIDSATLKFVRRLWEMAEKHRWPLFIVVTHWEREWNELHRLSNEAREDSLVWFQTVPGAEMRKLASASAHDLDAYLRVVLTGLASGQLELMVEKADGNFLTLVENVGALVDADFVDRRRDRPLSLAGERKIARWESKRDKRIEQRFGELEADVQDLLGWSSRVGQRFLGEVVSKFVAQRAPTAPPVDVALLETCITPYAILGKPAAAMFEFRDRAYHQAARQYFDEHLSEDSEAIDAALRETLFDWVNRSFDETGEALIGTHGQRAPENSIAGADPAVRLEVLNTAVRSLRLQAPAFATPEGRAAIRAGLLFRVYLHRVGMTGFGSGKSFLAFNSPSFPWEDVPIGFASPSVLIEVSAGAGQWISQLRMRRRAFSERRDVLGENHPLTQSAWVAIAVLYSDIRRTIENADGGQYDEGIVRRVDQIVAPAKPDQVRALGTSFLGVELSADDRTTHDCILRDEHASAELARSINAVGKSGSIESADAIPILRSALDFAHHGGDDPLIAEIESALGAALVNVNRFAEAEPLLVHAWKTRERILGPDDPLCYDLFLDLALSYSHLGRRDEAAALSVRLADMPLELRYDPGPEAFVPLIAQHVRQGRHELARRLAQRATAFHSSPSHLVRFATQLAPVYADVGQKAAAASLFERAFTAVDSNERVMKMFTSEPWKADYLALCDSASAFYGSMGGTADAAACHDRAARVRAASSEE